MHTFIQNLRNACGSIDKAWAEHLVDWQDDTPGDFNDMSAICNYMIDQMLSGFTDDFDAIFRVVEKAVEFGDKTTKELAVIGFLEGILLIGSHQGLNAGSFDRWIGSKSKLALVDLERFFQGQT